VRRAAAHGAALALLLLPALARAAGGGEEHGASHVWEWLNLALLVGVLTYFARKPIASYLAERRSGIERDLQGAEQLLRDAETRLAEWRARAARIEDEVASIKQLAREAAEHEAERIVGEAKAVAARIRRDAGAAVEREAQRARVRLRQETAELAISSAERLLRDQIGSADGDRLFDEFVTRVERPPGAPGRR
jgi:F-type H+-transporting ATPase subunit b